MYINEYMYINIYIWIYVYMNIHIYLCIGQFVISRACEWVVACTWKGHGLRVKPHEHITQTNLVTSVNESWHVWMSRVMHMSRITHGVNLLRVIAFVTEDTWVNFATHMSRPLCLYAHEQMCRCMCECVCMCVCVFLCVCIRVHKHTSCACV